MTWHLKDWRTLRGLSLERVANELGTSHTTLMRWEGGVHKVPDERIKQLAEIYGCTPAELEHPPEQREMGQRVHEAIELAKTLSPDDAQLWLQTGRHLAEKSRS